jgi:branched-chain amino acid transport system substrate-binding protein
MSLGIMRLRTFIVALVLGGLGACAPELDDQLWRCESHADCGGGFLCDGLAGHCVAALSNRDGVFDDRIVLGMSAALGNDVSLGQVGRAARTGLLACFHHVNRTGGVHGRTLQLVAADDSYDPAKTTSVVTKMVDGPDRQVFALSGVIGTGPSLAARVVALDKRVLFFGPATGFDGLEPDPPDRYVFNLRPRYSEEAAQLTQYLLERAKPAVPPANIALFAQGDDDEGALDAFGKSALAGIQRVLKPAGVTESAIPVGTYPVGNGKQVHTSLKSLLGWMASAAREPSADGKIQVGIVLAALHDSAAAFIRAAEDQLATVRAGGQLAAAYGSFNAAEHARLAQVELRFVSLSVVGENLTLFLRSYGKRIGGHYGVGTVVALPVPHHASSASGVLRYREHLHEFAPKEPPGFISLEAYLAGQLLVEGLRQQGRDITTESLIETLETLQVDLGIGRPVGFSQSSHQAFTRLWAAQLDADLVAQPLGVLLPQGDVE